MTQVATKAGAALLDWFGGPMRDENSLVELIVEVEREARGDSVTPEASVGERLREALDTPSSKLARAIGKARFGGTRSGHFFDEDGWAFLLGAVKEARAALATPAASEALASIALGRIKAIAAHFKDESKRDLRASLEAIFNTATHAYRPEDHGAYRVVPAASDGSLDAVYAERNRLVSALAHLFANAAWRGIDPNAPDWTVVYIDLPSGQVSWHIPDAEMDQFPPLALRDPTGWDGHDTDEKYRRLAALRRGDICRDVQEAVERVVAHERAARDTALSFARSEGMRADAASDGSVDALRELSDAATPGPWERLAGDEGRRVSSEPLRVLGLGDPVVLRIESNRHHADAAFVVAAVAYVRERLRSSDVQDTTEAKDG